MDKIQFHHPVGYTFHFISTNIYHLHIVKNVNELNLTAIIKRRTPDKHRSFYLFVFEEAVPSPEIKWLIPMCQKLWRKHILNAIFIFWHTKLNIFMYSPFENNKLIAISENETNPDNLFEDKTRDMNGYGLRITLYNEGTRLKFNRETTYLKEILNSFDRVDGQFIKSVLHHMNASFNLIGFISNYLSGEFFPNGSITGCFYDLVTNAADVEFSLRTYHYQYSNGFI